MLVMALGECPIPLRSYPSLAEQPLPSPRFVLADTEELHSQIAQMSQRIRQLEEALAVSHNSDASGDRHPLLRDELLAVKFGSGSRGSSEESDGDDQFTLSFGTLAITDTGGSRYFGVSAGALVSDSSSMSILMIIYSIPAGQAIC